MKQDRLVKKRHPIPSKLKLIKLYLPKVGLKSHVRLRKFSRHEWRRGLVGDDDAASLYTDEFKFDCIVGTGIYFDDLEISLSLSIRLPNSVSIIQAEVLSMEKVCGVL